MNNFKKFIYLQIILIIFFSYRLEASDICNLNKLSVVFKVKPDGTFSISSGESISFLGLVIPDEAGEYGKQEMVKYLHKNVFKKRVRFICDPLVPDSFEKDNNGNFRVYVYLEDGTFLNKELIKEGLAIIDYTYYYKEQKGFEEFEIQAGERKKGIWQIPTMEILTWRSRQPVNASLKPVESIPKIEQVEKKQELPKDNSDDLKKEKLKKYTEMIKNPTGVTGIIDEGTVKENKPKNIEKTVNNKTVSVIRVKSDGLYVGHKKMKVYHAAKCKKISWIKTDKTYFDAKQDAEDEGYTPDKECIK